MKYRPNNDIGFYQSIAPTAVLGDDKLSPGYTVTIGCRTTYRVFTGRRGSKPFFAIFVWTVVFSVLTASDRYRGYGAGLPRAVGSPEKANDLPRAADLPYAVPSFISILIFKGCFNQSFGEINMMLSAPLTSEAGFSSAAKPPPFDDYHRQHWLWVIRT